MSEEENKKEIPTEVFYAIIGELYVDAWIMEQALKGQLQQAKDDLISVLRGEGD